MVLRDKTQPKLCFDNPLYNTDGTARPSSELKMESKGSPGTVMAEHKAVSALKSNASLKSWNEDMRREMFSDRNSAQRGSNRSSMVPSSPDNAFEEHIIENIKNRDFWSRRSRTNPFTRMRVSALVASNTPGHDTPSGEKKHLEPVEFPTLEGAEAAPSLASEVAEADEDDNPTTSEMTLEALRERELRENITWLRNNLTEVSKADGGKFSLSTFLSTMKNKVRQINLLYKLSKWDYYNNFQIHIKRSLFITVLIISSNKSKMEITNE